MDTAPVTLPPPLPNRKFRPPKANIPQTIEDRNRVLKLARRYVQEFQLTPPMPAEELKTHADRCVEMGGIDPAYRDYTGVLMNNEMWREPLAAIPYERRLLLLPKCLRVEDKCTAPFDEFGLLCKQCGLCSIQDFQNEAERLGYAVLVAEGSAIVMSLIQTGKIEAIVGVSCLNVLERSFPYMEAAAIPGIAIPLLQDDCIDCAVDIDWVWDVIHVTSEDRTRRMDLDALREEVGEWFSEESLDSLMGPAQGGTEKLGREWLARAGKRWRPFLTVAVWKALTPDSDGETPEDVRRMAIAVECFHKASLIHDDIEDEDAERYGEATLHEEQGIAVALNVGDLLIGEGYRLLAELDVSPENRVAMLQVAADGQRALCRGQGAELLWARAPEPLSSRQTLGIFKEKTAPAFEVALRVGAAYAGFAEETRDVLGAYSENLGIAYQIRDDLSDWGAEGETDDLAGLRPSVVLALAHELAKGDDKALLKKVWSRSPEVADRLADLEALADTIGARDRAKTLQESYKESAIRSLGTIDNANLKGLLRRVVGKIFNDIEIKGWCKEFEAKNTEAASEAKPAAAVS